MTIIEIRITNNKTLSSMIFVLRPSFSNALENEGLKTNIIDERVLLLVILISMIVMLFGTLNNSKKQEDISLEIEKPLNDEIDSDFLNKQIND